MLLLLRSSKTPVRNFAFRIGIDGCRFAVHQREALLHIRADRGGQSAGLAVLVQVDQEIEMHGIERCEWSAG